MSLRLSFLFLLLLFSAQVFAQDGITIVKDLRSEWMHYEEDEYAPLEKFPIAGVSTVYLRLDPAAFRGMFLRLESSERYYVFINGKVRNDYQGRALLSMDSLLQSLAARPALIAIHQREINNRDLKTEIVSRQRPTGAAALEAVTRPYSHFRDFAVMAGLLVVILFVLALRLNPKLATDYLSVTRMFSVRDVDDSQAAARLTGGSNIQFYILCSMMLGYYLIIVLYNLPDRYALPGRFHATGFWMMWVQWLKLSALVFTVLLMKISIIFLVTRLFGMHGMTRFHFFNWIRLLLVVFGVATVLLFMYFIARGDNEKFYVMFLSLVAVTLVVWIVVAFFKLGAKSGHSMFHLFSYLCATEIIPLLITVKVLFE